MYGRCDKRLPEAKLRYIRRQRKRVIAEEPTTQEYSLICGFKKREKRTETKMVSKQHTGNSSTSFSYSADHTLLLKL